MLSIVDVETRIANAAWYGMHVMLQIPAVLLHLWVEYTDMCIVCRACNLMTPG